MQNGKWSKINNVLKRQSQEKARGKETTTTEDEEGEEAEENQDQEEKIMIMQTKTEKKDSKKRKISYGNMKMWYSSPKSKYEGKGKKCYCIPEFSSSFSIRHSEHVLGCFFLLFMCSVGDGSNISEGAQNTNKIGLCVVEVVSNWLRWFGVRWKFQAVVKHHEFLKGTGAESKFMLTAKDT